MNKKFAALVLLVAAAGCSRKPLLVQSQRAQQYVVDSSSRNGASDSAIGRFLQPYKAGVDTQMKTVIGYTDMPLTKAQPESSLGNFMAEAQLVAARRIDKKVEASILNYGGIRISYVAP